MIGWKARSYALLRPILPLSVRDMLELTIYGDSALVRSGWPRSRRAAMPVDAAGEPVPWYTYPAIRFLEQRVPSNLQVFEYGMGNSTLWWSRRAATVQCCEHDQHWFEKFRGNLPANVAAQLHPVASQDYVAAATTSERLIDVLVIDGRRRVACARHGIAKLSDQGIVIWDNTERDYYKPGIDSLVEAGFVGRVDFWGLSPMVVYESCTSIFYRPHNCLGL